MFPSTADGLEDVQFSDEEMKVIIEEAGRHGAYVAAHCSGLAGAKQAIRAGIKSVEHGINLDRECVELMKENDCFLVTTLNIALHLAEHPGLPDYMARKAALCADANRKSVKLVREAGVKAALGTDFSNNPESKNRYQFMGKEFAAICEAGYTEMEALVIGTINGAELMRKKDEFGSLDKGKLANIVIASGDPLQDIKILGDAENICFVMKEGKIVKNTMV